MTKRVKRSARVDIAGGYLLAGSQGGINVVTFDEDGRPIHRIHFDAEDIYRIQAADILEDVPEPKTPGQRVHAAEVKAELRSVEWGHLLASERAAYEVTAGLLGITEGE